jgi:hypothetical protein
LKFKFEWIEWTDDPQYIQSVGLNAKTVMGDVTNNMEQMNRFQFDGGVQGLAKMAAQSSMLKFDMKQTFAFADRVLDPECAINMAAAFQRLGVSVGNLTDPFALMNESINDPTGLQNSLARVGEKYTVYIMFYRIGESEWLRKTTLKILAALRL